MRRALIVAALPLFLAACGAESVYAPEEQVQAAVYRDAGPTSLTLFTMINNRSDGGAHTGLMVSGSQRVIFDPAGSWWHSLAPERNDVHFGMTPKMLEFYIDYHARETYRVEMMTVEVSPEVAELALQLVQAEGAVPKAMCANATSSILRQLPGFEQVPQTWFPNKIRDAFGKIPGVETQVIRQDGDSDDNSGILIAQQRVQVLR